MKQIENIFSSTPAKKSKPCPNPKTPIIIDKREQQSLITANLIEQKAAISHEILEIGDYLIADTIIERKTYSDFISSILDKRLHNQLIEMKKYPKYFLIIEGFDFTYKSRLHPNAIRGMILSITTDYKVPIIYTENSEDTAKFLILTAKKYETQKPLPSTRQTKTKLSPIQQKQFILEGFPGIGPTLAKNLLEEFKTLKNIFNAKKEQLSKFLDENKINKFLELLNS